MIGRLDHLVLTTRQRESCIDFYTRVLGMRLDTFGQGRLAFRFLAHEYFDRLVKAVPEIREYFENLTEERLLQTSLLLADDQIVEEDERVLV